MDVDNDHFYDEIASFMPTPGEYSFDDLDEIIRSTDSHLEASLDLNILPNCLEQNDFNMGNSETQPQQQQQTPQLTFTEGNEFNLDFSMFPSPATSSSDYITSTYETSARTSSTSSIDGDNFNPDDFINFLNDQDVNVDELTHESIRQLNHHNERNTPSPTGSYSSSSGSSTSGIQSDISSIASSMSQSKTSFSLINEQDQDELSEFIKFKSETESIFEETETDSNQIIAEEKHHQTEDIFRMPLSPNGLNEKGSNDSSGMPLVSVNIPLSTLQSVQPVSLTQGTIIPVQTTVPAIAFENGNISAASIKMTNKITTPRVPAQPLVMQQPIVANTPSSSMKNGSPAKITPPLPPPNAKPKTIFLSSNDFKALMQKMNTTNGGTNGTGTGSKKTTFSNGQMPKIIMKTASGKYITANKMPSSLKQQTKSDTTGGDTNSSTTIYTNYAQKPSSQNSTKTFNTSNSAFAHNHHARSSAALAAAAARASLQNSKGCRTDFSMMKGLSEDKIVKKQLRMLKNRESASLSRKKKKEYIERLEYRISTLEKENYSLKGENSSLRSQLMAFAKTCDCKHRNVSEFILNTLSMNERRDHGESVLSDFDASFLIDEEDSSDQSERGEDFPSPRYHNCESMNACSATRHVKIAPKPLNATSSSINKNFRNRMNSSTVKKNVAVLFAMAFMVTLNVGNFQSYLNKNALENALEATQGTDAATNEGTEHGGTAGTGRRLLWVPNENEFREQNNRSKREADFHNMPPPPLHFLRPVNRSTTDELIMNGTTTKDEPPIRMKKYGPTAYGNGTNYAQENNMRLARNLHKWIGGNDYLNLTGTDNKLGGGEMTQYKFGKSDEYDDFELENPGAKVGIKQKRKIFLGPDVAAGAGGKHTKYDMEAEAEQNSLGLYKARRISEEYLKLFRGIKRQDDTFYVLSFNLDHILLPASAYNKSARPKMSLMLPAGDPSLNGDIVLMQIDCEVINTTEIELKSHMIPEKLRPLKYGPNPNDVSNNETKSGGGGATTTRVKNGDELHLKREEDSHERPTAPRTYFMMGPKNHSSIGKAGLTSGETVIKKRPTIVKLNANDSVIGSGIMSVRNSSIFTRMKDTVVNSGATGGFPTTATATTATEFRKII